MRDLRRQESSKSTGLRRNEQVKKVFWALFTGLAGIILAQVVDPETALQVVGILTELGR